MSVNNGAKMFPLAETGHVTKIAVSHCISQSNYGGVGRLAACSKGVMEYKMFGVV